MSRLVRRCSTRPLPLDSRLTGFLLLLLLFPTVHLQAQTAQSLAELAGWRVPGLETVQVGGVTVGDGFFTGDVPDLQAGGGTATPRVAGFTVSGTDGMVVVITLNDFTLPDYISSLEGSGLENLVFTNLRLVWAPAEVEGNTVSPPSQVTSITGSSLTLPAGPRVEGRVELRGTPAQWMAAIGMVSEALPIVGTIPVGVFTGAITAAQVATALYPLLDLTVTPPASVLSAAAAPVPGVTFSGLDLRFTGASGSPSAQLSGQASVGGESVQVSASENSSGGGGGGSQDSGAVTVQGNLSLADLVGVDLPALNSLSLSSLTFGGGGAVAQAQVGSKSTTVYSFGPANARAVGITMESLRLSDLVPEVVGTPLDDLTFSTPTLVYSSGSARGIQLPPALQSRTGSSTLDLTSGLSLSSPASMGGPSGGFLSGLGLPTSGLSVTGTIDPSILGDAIHIPDLSFTLPMPPGAAGGLSLTNPRFTISAANGVVTAQVDSDGRLTLGTLTFEISDAVIARASDGVTTLGASVPTSALSSLVPLPGVTARGVNLSMTLGGDSPTISLEGEVGLNGKNLHVQATWPEGTGSGPAIDITGDVTLGDLSGTSIPGLSDIQMTALHVNNGNVVGDLTFKTIDFHVVVFHIQGQSSPNIALTVPELKLSDIHTVFAGTPFDEFQLKPAALIMVPPGNSQTRARVPEEVSGSTGQEEVDLKPGMNLASLAVATGAVGDLLDQLHVPKSGLPMDGSFDPAVFSNVSPSELLSRIAIDLSIPLGDLTIPGVPGFVTTSGNTLRITTGGGNIAVGVHTDARVAMPNTDPMTFSSTITLGQEDGHEFLEISGESDYTWRSPFQIDWVTLRDLELSARFGTLNDFSIGATTDLGSVRNLKVATRLTLDGGTIREAGIEALDADIPLDAIPFLASIPGVDQIVLRDLTISNTAIAGMGRLRGHDEAVDAVLFRSEKPSPGWNVAMMMSGLSLADLIPPLASDPAAQDLLGHIPLSDLALTLSQYGVEDDMEALPRAAQERMTKIFGAAPRVRLANGIGILGGIDPTAMSPELKQVLATVGLGEEKLVLGGTVGGIFGGELALELRAMLPSVTFPEELTFVGEPASIQASFYLNFLPPTDIGFGVALATRADMPTQTNIVPMESEIRVELNPTGGVLFGVRGTTKGPWNDAFGLKGVTLRPESLLGMSVSASSEVIGEITGRVTVGTDSVDVTGVFGMIVGTGAPVPTRAAFGGRISEIRFADIIGLTNAVVTAGGGAPVLTDFPDVRLTDAKIGFASPGQSLPEYNITGGGISIGGQLWMFFDDAPLGQFEGAIDMTGIVAKGDIHDFELAGLSMKGNYLDVYAKVDPMNPPHFNFRGNATIEGNETTMEMQASVSRFLFKTAQTFPGAHFAYDFGVFYEGPSTLSPQALAELDLGLDASLELDGIQNFLAGPGADAAGGGMDAINATMDSLNANLRIASQAVETLSDSVDHYRAVVQRDRQSSDQQLAAAKQAVAAAQDDVNDLNAQIRAAQSKIHEPCNQTKRICVWRNLLTGKCTSYQRVADVGARLKCGTDNTYYYGVVLTLTGQREIAQGILEGANATLSLLQEGNDVIPVDADPRVAYWIGLLEGARAGLNLAQEAVAGMQDANAAGQRALAIFEAGASAIQLQNGRIQGSFQQWLRGSPVILDIEYRVAGQDLNTRIPFNPGDPVYTNQFLELLALEAAYYAVEYDPNASEAVKMIFELQYTAKLSEVEAELEVVNAANAVPPDGGTP